MLSLYFLMTYFSLCTHISVSTGCRHDHLTQVVLNIAFHLLYYFPIQIHSQIWMVSVLPETGWVKEDFGLRISRGVQYVHWVMHKCIMVKAEGTRNTHKVCKKQVNFSKTGGISLWP